MSDDNFQLSLFDDEIEKKSRSLDYITIDFETANQYGNSAISVGLVRYVDGKEVDSMYELICPPTNFFVEEWINEIHHIRYEDVKDKPKFPEVWDTKIVPFIEKHALTFLGEKFSIKYLAHEALEDAKTCGLVVKLAAEKVKAGSVEELLKKCGLKMEKL